MRRAVPHARISPLNPTHPPGSQVQASVSPFLHAKKAPGSCNKRQTTKNRRHHFIAPSVRPSSPRGAAESRFHLIGPGCAEECSLITGEAMRRSCARLRSSLGAKSAIRRFSGFRCGPGKTHTHTDMAWLSGKQQRSQF